MPLRAGERPFFAKPLSLPFRRHVGEQTGAVPLRKTVAEHAKVFIYFRTVVDDGDPRSGRGRPSVKVQPLAVGVVKQLVKTLAEKENVTEKLKAENTLLWIRKMNNIRNRATEIVNVEVIYV